MEMVDSVKKPTSSIDADLSSLMAEINKQFGEKDDTVDKPVKMLNDVESIGKEDIIPTGVYDLDKALHVGGYARGRLHELWGAESSTKSSHCIFAAIEAQKKFPDEYVMYIDSEHAFNPAYAESLGLDLDRVVFSQPDCGEDGLTICEKACKSKVFSLIIIDSIAALLPAKVIRSEIEDERPGAHAKMIAQGLIKIVPAASKSNTCVLLVNQTRTNLGIMYGDNTTRTGGQSLKFTLTTSIKLVRQEGKDNKQNGVNLIKIEVVKNKLAPPYAKAKYDFILGKGVPKEYQALNFAIDNGIIDKRGGWYYYGDMKMQGRDSVIKYLEENQEKIEDIFNGVC